MNKLNAEKYVKESGWSVARHSTHYATARQCGCGDCFCCEVKRLVDEMSKVIVEETTELSKPCT